MSWINGVDGPIPAPIFGEPDEDGFPTIIGEEPGYRLNLLSELMKSEFEPYRTYPGTPLRIWAGDEPEYQTIFLLFEDEEEAKEVLSEYWIDNLE